MLTQEAHVKLGGGDGWGWGAFEQPYLELDSWFYFCVESE